MSQEAILQEISDQLRSQGARLNFLEGRRTTDTKTFNTQLDNSSSSLYRFGIGANSVTGSVIGFGEAAASGRARLQDFYSTFSNVPILKTLTGPASGLMEYGNRLLNSYRDLTRSGAGFGGSLKDMMVAAAESRLGLENFNAMVRINAETFASAPGGIEKGVSTFVDAQKKLMGEGSDLRKDLLALGYTAEDTGVFLGDIIRRQGNMSVKGALDADQLAKATASYAMELDTVSKLTGKRKEQIADEIRKATEDAFFKRAQMGMDQTQKMLSDRFMAQANMLGPEMTQLMQLVMSGADPVGTPEYQRMMIQTQGAGDEILKLARSAMQSRDANATLLPSIIKSAASYGNLADQVGFTTIATMKSRGDTMLYNQEMLNFANRVKHLTDQGISEDQAAAKITEEARAVQAKQLTEGKNQAAELANAEASIRDFGVQLTIVTSNILPNLIGGLAALTTKVIGSGSGLIKEQQPNIEKFFNTIKADIDKVSSAAGTGNIQIITDTIKQTALNRSKDIASAGIDGLLSGFSGIAPEVKEQFKQRLLNWIGLNTPTSERISAATSPVVPPTNNLGSEGRTTATSPAVPPTNDLGIFYDRVKDSVSSAVKEGFIGVIRAIDPLSAELLKGAVNPAPRARGGFVDPGSYLVGEEGPEVLNLGARGDVINNDNLTAMISALSVQNDMGESIDQLNNTNSQMLSAIRDLIDISKRNLTATKGLNGNLFAA
jgi:hypothetical protein